MRNDDGANVCGLSTLYRREIFMAAGDLILGFLVCGTPHPHKTHIKHLDGCSRTDSMNHERVVVYWDLMREMELRYI